MNRPPPSLPPFYREHMVSAWLLGVCLMVFIMVILGGLTRLTDSGLSMVNWAPVTGWLPPMNDREWRAAFAGYKKIPEYLELNAGMTIAEFRGIFWLEYLHRLWGRIIGVAFLVPLLFFLVKGWIPRRVIPVLVLFFVLGGMQGVLGWFMVKSGLADRVDVSPYRLTAHLGLAVVIYALMFRYALRIRRGYEAIRPVSGDGVARVRAGLLVVTGLIFVTILSGGFVAGLDAGLTYNTFPLMDGRLIPRGLYGGDSGLPGLFEDVTTVQFHHRLLAVFTIACLIVFWMFSWRAGLSSVQRRFYGVAVLTGCVQGMLGVSTLVLAVPVDVALAHQAGAFLFLSATLAALHHVEWGRRTL